MRQSKTYDQGREMAMHKDLSKRMGVAVRFCDPNSPWQRGSNENTNGLVSQYLPKRTDPTGYSQGQGQGQLNAIVGSCSRTAHNTPPSFIEIPGVALQV